MPRLVREHGEALAAVLAFGVLAMVPTVSDSAYTVRIFGFAAMWALLALGVNIVVGMSGQFAVCQAAFWGIGAYSSALAAINWHLPFFVALVFATLLTAIIGGILGVIVLRLRGHYLAIATFGFGVIVHQVLVNWIPLTRGPAGLTGIPPPDPFVFFGTTVLNFPDINSSFYLMLFLLALGVLGSQRLARSRIHLALNAIREDEAVAEVAGIPTVWYKLIAFTISAAYGGVAGSWWAHTMMVLSPDTFVFSQSAMMLIMAVAGGLGSTYGVAIAAAALTLAPEYLRGLADWQLVAYGAILLGVIVFFPTGLAGAWNHGKARLLRRHSELTNLEPEASPGERGANEVVVKP